MIESNVEVVFCDDDRTQIHFFPVAGGPRQRFIVAEARFLDKPAARRA
jgi:hypothetical protein